MDGFIELLFPWETSPLILVGTGGAVLMYGIGLARGGSPGRWRAISFVAGVALFYAVTQTHFDYYSQYLFFAHRGQHLVLHHLAPFLVALSAPGPVLAAALPGWRISSSALRRAKHSVAKLYRGFQNPWLAGMLFVGLIAFWLIPDIHFDAMLSRRLYWIMNWSMALDGLLFWWLVFARNPAGATPHLTFGSRVLLLMLIIPPQMLIGATLAFSEQSLFDVYDVCGRAFPIAPMDDQQLGGLITWIPAVMMSMAGVLILLVRQLGDFSDERPGKDEPGAPCRIRHGDHGEHRDHGVQGGKRW
ncbi:cytochrome c oxidase assembly protein [Thiohalomonas denitrificans]|uniref:Cytochrome c oxidase assembly factor CtaG n=1 Tax=Thiohalomonas denitrificans TaxID=415747 RepID=A0A1G5Q3R6_9GAMM|nr:cytochrome c oxidase assembly protein [Thiohalomonas denitrificans]SCZ56258.1 Cytochrome c oxidase assembly factor CtaG [Thiohalomonas denitrificans]